MTCETSRAGTTTIGMKHASGVSGVAMFVAGINAHATYSVIAIVSNTGQLVAGPIRIKNTQEDRLDDLLQQYQPLEVVVETSPAVPTGHVPAQPRCVDCAFESSLHPGTDDPTAIPGTKIRERRANGPPGTKLRSIRGELRPPLAALPNVREPEFLPHPLSSRQVTRVFGVPLGVP